MFPITSFDGGRRSAIDDSANSVMVSGVRIEERTPSRTTAELDEARTAVLSWAETIQWARSDTEIILHS